MADRTRDVLAKVHEVDVEPGQVRLRCRENLRCHAVQPEPDGVDGLVRAEPGGAASSQRGACRSSSAWPARRRGVVPRALDMGINDYVTRPVHRNQAAARVRTQIKRKRHRPTSAT